MENGFTILNLNSVESVNNSPKLKEEFIKKSKKRLSVSLEWILKRIPEIETDKVSEYLNFFTDITTLSLDIIFYKINKITRLMILASIFYSESAHGQENNLKFNNPQRSAYNSLKNLEEYIKLNSDPEVLKNEEEELKKIRRLIKSFTLMVDRYKNSDSEKEKQLYALSKTKLDELLKIEEYAIKNLTESAVSKIKGIKPEDLAKIKEQLADDFLLIDEVRKYMFERVSSEKYREMAKKEGLTEEEIEERIKASGEDSVSIEDSFHSLKEGLPNTGFVAGMYTPKIMGRIFGIKPGKIVMSSDRSQLPRGQEMESAIAHELGHSLIDTRDVSDVAKKIYNNALRENIGNNKEYIDYLSRIDELDAMRIAFQYEIEKLGVWKYGEVFTKEHYEKIDRLSKEKKLSMKAEQFFEIIKTEKLIEMMNMLALKNKDQVERNSRFDA